MKIICCVKHCPDSAARIDAGADGRHIKSEGIDFGPSPFDEYGVEEAIKLRDKAGAGEVIVISAGDDAAVNSLRKAMAMGADRAKHVKGVFEDPASTAAALAKAIEGEKPDIVFCGKEAIDTNAGCVPAFLACALSLPLVTHVCELAVDSGQFKAKRPVEGGLEVIEGKLPAVISCTKGLNEPRFPSLPGIMKAKKKPVDSVDAGSVQARSSVTSLTLPERRKAGRFNGQGASSVPGLMELLKNEVQIL